MLRRLRWNYYPINSFRKAIGCYTFSQNQPQHSANPGRIVKLNRRKANDPALSHAEPTYSNSQQHMTATEAAYHENIKKKVEENLATQRFYHYEIERGEDLIDTVPVNPYYEYKVADLKLEIQARQRMVDNLKGLKVFQDPDRYQKLKSTVAGFQTIKHRYELEEFEKKIKLYPGSVRGPNPEDDPAVFNEYVLSIIPEWLLMELKAKQKKYSSDADINLDAMDADKDETYFCRQHITDKLQYEPKFNTAEEQDERPEEDIQFVSEEGGNTVRYSPIPLYPHTKFEEYHSYLSKLRTWDAFKSYHTKVNQKKNIKALGKTLSDIAKAYFEKIGTQVKPKNNLTPAEISQATKQGQDDGVKKKQKKAKGQGKKEKKKAASKTGRKKNQMGLELKPMTYSLYTYYKTLPKEIQEDPRVRTVYLGLEYSSPDISYQQKEEVLNEAAKLSLPLDKFSIAVMDKALQQTRAYLTPHLVDRIYNMNPEFTWDIHQFLTEVKDEKLRSISTVKEKELSFIEPPELQKRWEEGMANLPVDFYDNEDGFWTDYIDQKLKKKQLVQPLSKKPKKHFIH